MTADKDLIYLQNANATGKTYMAGMSVEGITNISMVPMVPYPLLLQKLDLQE